MKENVTADPASANYPEINKIGDDLRSLKSNVAGLVGHIKREGLHDIAEAAQSEYASLGKVGLQVQDKIKAQPVKSVAVAFAGGLLASYLLGRR